MTPKPGRESRALSRVIVHLCSQNAIEKLVVTCIVASLLGCGAKNGVANDTASDNATRTPATVEQAASVLDLSHPHRIRVWDEGWDESLVLDCPWVQA